MRDAAHGRVLPPLAALTRSRAAPPILVAVAVLACFAPLVLGRCLVGGDLSACFEPLARALSDGAWSGDVLRTQRLFNGLPLLAHPGVAACYPPQYLVALMEPARALTLLSLVHLALAGAGTVVLARRLGASASGAVAAGLVLALSGAGISSLVQINLVRSMAWLPWVVALTDATMRRPRERSGLDAVAPAGLAACVMLLLLGLEPFVVLPALAGALLMAVPREGEGRRDVARGFASAALAATIGAVAALALAWPALRYVPESVRGAGLSPAAVAEWSLHPAQALGLLVPHPFGDARACGLDGFCAPSLVGGRSNEYFLAMHVGGLALALALAGLAAGRRGLVAGFVLAVLVLAALGAHGPVQPLLDRAGIDWLRYPVKWMLPAMLPLALLVAWGVDALGRPGARGLARGSLLSIALVGAVVTLLAAPLGSWIASLAPAALPDDARLFLAEAARSRLLIGGAWAAGLPALVLVACEWALRSNEAVVGRRLAISRVVAVSMLLAGLVVAARGVVTTAPASFYTDVPPLARALLNDGAKGRTWLDTEAIGRLRAEPVPRTLLELVGWQRERLMDYTGASYGIDVVLPDDVEALAPARMATLARVVRACRPEQRLMLLGAAGVSLVVAPDRESVTGRSPVESVETRGGTLQVFRNLLVTRRARVVRSVKLVDGVEEIPQGLAAVRQDFFELCAVVERPDWQRAMGSTPSPAIPWTSPWSGKAEIVDERAGSVTVDVDGDGGLLVLSDAWLPGWSATVDGVAVPVVPADVAFLGVLVPAGRHVAVLSYAPGG